MVGRRLPQVTSGLLPIRVPRAEACSRRLVIETCRLGVGRRSIRGAASRARRPHANPRTAHDLRVEGGEAGDTRPYGDGAYGAGGPPGAGVLVCPITKEASTMRMLLKATIP